MSEHLTYLREVLEHDAIGFGEDFQFQDAVEHLEALEHASEQYRKAMSEAADRIEQLTAELDKAVKLGKAGGYKATPEHSWAEWCDELYRDLNKAAARIEKLESLFPAILEYLENQADVVDGDNGIPAPNIAMSLLVWTKHALEK